MANDPKQIEHYITNAGRHCTAVGEKTTAHHIQRR